MSLDNFITVTCDVYILVDSHKMYSPILLVMASFYNTSVSKTLSNATIDSGTVITQCRPSNVATPVNCNHTYQSLRSPLMSSAPCQTSNTMTSLTKWMNRRMMGWTCLSYTSRVYWWKSREDSFSETCRFGNNFGHLMYDFHWYKCDTLIGSLLTAFYVRCAFIIGMQDLVHQNWSQN